MRLKFIAICGITIMLLGGLTGCGGGAAESENMQLGENDSAAISTESPTADAGQSTNDLLSENEAKRIAVADAGSVGDASGIKKSAISIDKAKEIIMKKVKGAKADDVRIRLENDNGRQKYEGFVIYEGTEYNFELNALDGSVLEWEEEVLND